MRKLEIFLILAATFVSSCEQQETKSITNEDLTSLKNQFISTLSAAEVDEGPFHFNYEYRTVFFSKEIISLVGELSVHDRLPHGWSKYETKTLYKMNGEFIEVELDDLFRTVKQKEFLRKTCEERLKSNPVTYFSGSDSSRCKLKQEDIHDFVFDDQGLIILFQPYSVGEGSDGPITVRIAFNELQGKCETSSPIYSLLDKALESQDFISSWDKERFSHNLGYYVSIRSRNKQQKVSTVNGRSLFD